MNNYREKKDFYNNLLTIYGRKPVLEALEDSRIQFYKLHLADSNQRDQTIKRIYELAEHRKIEIRHHNRQALSRISKNSKQDQGVAADLELPGYQSLEKFLSSQKQHSFRLIAADGITNPQNLGMLIRSVAAGQVDGLIIPKKGTAALGPLVIKASAGTALRCPILYSETAQEAAQLCHTYDVELIGLSSRSEKDIFSLEHRGKQVFMLGNETEGVSKEVEALCHQWVKIPMNNGVESLNVAVTGALIAFSPFFTSNKTNHMKNS